VGISGQGANPKGGKRFLFGHMGAYPSFLTYAFFFPHNSCHLSPHRPCVQSSPPCIVVLFVCLGTGSDNGVGGRILETYGDPALVGQPDPQVYGHVSDIDWKLSTCSTAVRSQFAKVRMVRDAHAPTPAAQAHTPFQLIIHLALKVCDD